MNTNKPSARITAPMLMRLAGISAAVTGLGFIIVGVFHQENIPSSVTTATWVNVHIVAALMGFFGLFGLAGLYTRQAEKAGWLGLAGFVLFSIWLACVIPFSFVEAFILPSLATELPAFVEGFLGMFTKVPSEIDLGLLPTLWAISDPMYLLGPLLFGIATVRAGVLPRWAGALMVLGSTLGPVGALLVSPEYQSLIMVPNGIALIWLGYALFAERRAQASTPVLDLGTVRSAPSNAG